MDCVGQEYSSASVKSFRWGKDRRLAEVAAMLDSSTPVPITVVQKPDMSDHDFVEEQERSLQAKCVRTMGLAVGRGAFSLRTSFAVMTEQLTMPKLCLTGRAPPRGATVEMDHIDTVPNMDK